jgi:hypothetical protein
MFSVITNIYNKKIKELTLMEMFTGKLKSFFDIYRCSTCAPRVKNTDARVVKTEYRIDVCPVTRGAHIEHL